MSHTPTLSIAVLAGGYSGESVISLKSADTIMENIDRSIFSPLLVKIERGNWWVESDGDSYDIDKKVVIWENVADKEPQIQWFYDKHNKLRKQNFDMSDSYCAVLGFMKKENIWV